MLLAALTLRILGINWDQGFHLHPDERMLIMVADRISFFKNLNPVFFNYGSLPIYFLKGGAQLLDFFFKTELANYNGMLVLGRLLSAGFDILTIIFIYKISRLLFKNTKIALFSSFFYSVAFFPIQNSHFFVVDVFLTTFTTILVYLLLIFLKSPTFKQTIKTGIIFAAMMATKFTAIIFLPVIIGIIFYKTRKQFYKFLFFLLIFHLSFFICHFLFMPYAYLDFGKFVLDIKQQLAMNSNPWIFPYTLQYVGTVPYFYYLKNIFLWGLGPVISILSLIGILKLKIESRLNREKIVFIGFYLFYFLIVGRSAVKFMRYMLPLYPLFAISASFGLYKVYKRFKVLAYLFILMILLWSFSFMNIYSQTHTRISATQWILKNVPVGSTLAVEHWDDRLPVFNGEDYKYEELTLYDQPDDEVKWKILDEKLRRADYIIIASNRLSVPLPKLANCSKYLRCFPKTNKYYKKLFNDKLSFRKAAEFSVSPLFLNDQSADESFTVYDHPKIVIFKRLH